MNAPANLSAARFSVDNFGTIERLAKELPAQRIVDLIRSLNSELSFSYGCEQIDKGCDMIAADLRDEQDTIDGMPDTLDPFTPLNGAGERCLIDIDHIFRGFGAAYREAR